MKVAFVPLVLFSLFTACGDGKPAPGTAPASPAAQQLVLAKDPGAAESVVDAKTKGARPDVVVVGRISEVVKGKVAFTLMDTELAYCGEVKPEDDCKTPWDYCCESPERRTANSVFVEARGTDQKPLASALPDLRLLDKVKVKGKLEVDAHGNFVLLATGLWRVERPQLPDDLKWPH